MNASATHAEIRDCHQLHAPVAAGRLTVRSVNILFRYVPDDYFFQTRDQVLG